MPLLLLQLPLPLLLMTGLKNHCLVVDLVSRVSMLAVAQQVMLLLSPLAVLQLLSMVCCLRAMLVIVLALLLRTYALQRSLMTSC